MIYKVLFLCLLVTLVQGNGMKQSLTRKIKDSKEYEKLLKSKTNSVLVLYLNRLRAFQPIKEVFREAAVVMKGQAVFAIVNCTSSEGKKLCQMLKIPTHKSYFIKHYKNGLFHRNYDRLETVTAMSNFLRNPTEDVPWDEDPEATCLYHLSDVEAISKFLKRGVVIYQKALVMFFAPWCAYCRSMKPVFLEAAEKLMGEAYLAAVDVTKEGNRKIRELYNITVLPTLLYYEKGKLRFPYTGPNSWFSLVRWVRDPESNPTPPPVTYPAHPAPPSPPGPPQPPAPSPPGPPGSPPPGPPAPPPQRRLWATDWANVLHLTEKSFDDTVGKAARALVVFHAPWCAYCDQIKPRLEVAAAILKQEKIAGVIGEVDGTEQVLLASRFGVDEYPRIKYFELGQYKRDLPETTSDEDMIALMSRDFGFQYYRPYPPRNFELTGIMQDGQGTQMVHMQAGGLGAEGGARRALSNQEAGFGANVLLVDDSTFDQVINSPTLTFVMFYTTWCGHCVATKPAFSKLATTLKGGGGGAALAVAVAVEAAENPRAADAARVDALPALRLYSRGKPLAEYQGDRSHDDMLRFLHHHARHGDRDEL